MKDFLASDAQTGGAFDPETVRVITAAFDEAWGLLMASGAKTNDEMREQLAKRIIEFAGRGERNQRQLRDGAMLYFAQSKLKILPRHGLHPVPKTPS